MYFQKCQTINVNDLRLYYIISKRALCPNNRCTCVCFSPEMSPLKSVPQIRIEMDPDDDNSFYWKSRGSETSL